MVWGYGEPIPKSLCAYYSNKFFLCQFKKVSGSLSNVVEKYYRKILGYLCSTALPCFVIEHIEDAATEVFKVPKSVADTL